MIPLVRPLIGREERAAVDRVLESGHLAQGPEVAAFEDEFSDLVGGGSCVAVNSGTAALHLGLLAAGVGPGDEVIVPSFTFAATANAVRLAGARPVFVDIDPATFCVDVAAVAAAVGPATAAVAPVHLYGHPAPMPALADLARRHGILLVEDAAQAHGATIGDDPVGSFGEVAAFSFYPTKNMTTGEGGMVVARSSETARQVRLLRNQGMERPYANEIVGFNARMTEVAAAIGRVQLRRLPAWNEHRRAHAARLTAALSGVVTPQTAAGVSHVFHQYTIRSPARDRLRSRLERAGVGTGVYYPTPTHRLPAYDERLDLPHTERAAAEVLSLPVRPDLKEEEVDMVVEAVNA